jgi:uncharacterized membrane protein
VGLWGLPMGIPLAFVLLGVRGITYGHQFFILFIYLFIFEGPTELFLLPKKKVSQWDFFLPDELLVVGTL